MRKKLRAGDLRHLVLFQRKTSTVDSFNNAQENWEDDFEDWVSMEALGSSEFNINWQRFSDSTMRFHMWFRSDIDPAEHRIVVRNDRYSPARETIWDLKPPYDPDGHQVEMYIEAVEVMGTNAH